MRNRLVEIDWRDLMMKIVLTRRWPDIDVTVDLSCMSRCSSVVFSSIRIFTLPVSHGAAGRGMRQESGQWCREMNRGTSSS